MSSESDEANRGGCAWCGSTDADAAWPGPEPRDFQVRRCRSCGHHYTVPVLGPGEIVRYYEESYYGAANRRFHPLMEGLVSFFRRRRACALERFVRPGRALDIGCGRGRTLATLRDRGWEVEGCEFSETSSRFAREVLNLNVRTGGFVPANYADCTFDAVILWHVLEHLPDARAAVAAVARMLKPGGVLAVAVPNFESYQAKWTRYGWFHLDMPRHYSHFSASWLRRRLQESGFRIADEFHGSLEQNPYGWIQSILNRWRLPRNLLYDLLRRSSARATVNPWRKYPFASLLSLVGLFVLLPPALAMIPVERLMRRGATVDFYAVREG